MTSNDTCWFLTGSQGLYGPETLAQVEQQSRAIVDQLSCGFAPLTLDCRSCDQAMGRDRLRPSRGQGGWPVVETLSTAPRAPVTVAFAVSYWARQRCRSATECKITLM